MKTCPICKKGFEPSCGHNEQIFCSLTCYWKSKKIESGYQKLACVDCGSVEIFKHGVHQIPKKICSECYKLRWKKLNQDKNFYKKHAICKKCGTNSKAGIYQLKIKDGEDWICQKCKKKEKVKKIKIGHCLVCGIIWEYPRHEYKSNYFCSKKCSESKYLSYFKPKGEKRECTDCGIGLSPTTRAHKKTGLQCNECSYIRRRMTKDRAIYGEDYLQIIGKTRLIDSIGIHFNKNYQGGSLCNGKRLDWLKVVRSLERLFK